MKDKITRAAVGLALMAGGYILIENPHIFWGVFLMMFGNNLTQERR